MHQGLCPVQWRPQQRATCYKLGKTPHIVEKLNPLTRGRIAKPQNNFCPSRWYLEGKTLASSSKDLRSKQGECFCTWHLGWLSVSPLSFLHNIFLFVLNLTALWEFVLCNKAHLRGHCNSFPLCKRLLQNLTTYSTQIRQNTR